MKRLEVSDITHHICKTEAARSKLSIPDFMSAVVAFFMAKRHEEMVIIPKPTLKKWVKS